MPAPQNPTPGNASGVWEFKDYFFPDGDVTIRVEKALFRVHKYFFRRESSYFQNLFRTSVPCKHPPGSSDANPVVLEDTTIEAFAGLCWVFYNPKYSIYTTTVDKWVEILKLAQRWGFKEVEQLCIRELQELSIPPVEKIQIYQDFNIDRSLLAESFAKLIIRPELLNLEEAEKIGTKTTLQISQARELSRGSSSGTRPASIQLDGTELRSVIRDAFGLEEEGLDFLPPPPPPHPSTDTGNRKPKKS